MSLTEKPRVLEGVDVVLRRGGLTLLRRISFSAVRGELVFVVGPNGAGKSSLVRCLAGLISLDEGTVRLEGRPLREMSRREIAKRIALVEQTPDVPHGFSVHEVVAMGRAPFQDALLRPAAGDARVVDRALERCDLVSIADRAIEALSGGEQRRVAVARALAQQADVLLMDEPGAHLDAGHSLALSEIVRDEVDRHARACVVVTHDLNVASQFGDRVVVMSAGEIVADGAPDQALSADVVRSVFGAQLVTGELPGVGRCFVPARLRIS